MNCGLAAGILQQLLADDELRQHDEGERLEERVVLIDPAQRGRVGRDTASRWSAR